MKLTNIIIRSTRESILRIKKIVESVIRKKLAESMRNLFGQLTENPIPRARY